jgi:hypothetical protein
VSGLTLVNAATDKDIAALVDGSVIHFARTGTSLNIRVTTVPTTVGSVVFTLDGKKVATETYAPYAIAGDNNGDYNPWTPSLGAHTLTVTPFAGAGGTGLAGKALTVHFTVSET